MQHAAPHNFLLCSCSSCAECHSPECGCICWPRHCCHCWPRHCFPYCCQSSGMLPYSSQGGGEPAHGCIAAAVSDPDSCCGGRLPPGPCVSPRACATFLCCMFRRWPSPSRGHAVCGWSCVPRQTKSCWTQRAAANYSNFTTPGSLANTPYPQKRNSRWSFQFRYRERYPNVLPTFQLARRDNHDIRPNSRARVHIDSSNNVLLRLA